jgi:hypothetical protein
MGVVDQAVEDGAGDGGIADLLVPVIHRKLTGDDGRGMTVSLLDDLQKVSSFGVDHGPVEQVSPCLEDIHNAGYGILSRGVGNGP